MGWTFPPVINWKRDARNGHTPAAQFYSQCVAGINHATGYRRKEVYSFAWELGDSSTGATGKVASLRFRYRVGYGCTDLTFVAVMGLDDIATGDDPLMEIEVYDDDAATTTSPVPIHYGIDGNSSSNDPPDSWLVANRHVVVVPGNAVEVTIYATDYARPLALMVYEQADRTIQESTSFFSALAPAEGTPIYDAHQEILLSGASKMYRGNAGSSWHWCLKTGGAQTLTAATATNLIDGSTTGSPAVTAPGVYLNNVYRNTESRTDVPYEMHVYASIGAGSATVTLANTSGTALITVTIDGAVGWYSATGLLPNTDAFYGLQFTGDAANEVSVYAVSLCEWEAD